MQPAALQSPYSLNAAQQHSFLGEPYGRAIREQVQLIFNRILILPLIPSTRLYACLGFDVKAPAHLEGLRPSPFLCVTGMGAV